MRWAFPTASDYYRVLRPHIVTSDAAIPSRAVARDNDMGSQVPLMCLSPDVGSTCTPVAVRTVVPLYRPATCFHASPAKPTKLGANYNPAPSLSVRSAVHGNEASDGGLSPSPIWARLAALPMKEGLGSAYIAIGASHSLLLGWLHARMVRAP